MRRAALRLAAWRGRGLVVVYHRVRTEGPLPHDVVPVVESSLVRRQIEALVELGDVVPLRQLIRDRGTRGNRARFALTFDDDDPAHVRVALPLLRALGVPATFFLSGRALHGLGPYWWVALERLVADRGIEAVARMLAVAASTPRELAARREGTPLAQELVRISADPHGDAAMVPADVRSLADAGMTIGFHTLTHPVLPLLPPDEMSEALVRGRRELEEACGRPVELLAYPHARSDDRVARAAKAAGYEAAFVAGGRPIGAGSNLFELGRWEPGALGIDDFVAGIAVRLNRVDAWRR